MRSGGGRREVEAVVSVRLGGGMRQGRKMVKK